MALLERVKSDYDVDHETWRWSGLGQGDVGDPVVCLHKQDKTFWYKAVTPGTGTVTLEGTPDPGLPRPSPIGTAGWGTLHDPRGPGAGDLSALALGTRFETRQCLEQAQSIRPNVDGGVGAAGVEVWVIMKGRG